MQAYHDHLGRFGAIFGEYQPADLVEVQRLHQVSREIELKRQLLDSQGANLELSLCPLLCAPMTWAASKWSTSKAKAEGMLKYSDKEIHRPLVRLEELAPHALDKKGQVEKKEAQVMGGRCRHLLTTTTTTSNSPPPPPLSRSGSPRSSAPSSRTSSGGWASRRRRTPRRSRRSGCATASPTRATGASCTLCCCSNWERRPALSLHS